MSRIWLRFWLGFTRVGANRGGSDPSGSTSGSPMVGSCPPGTSWAARASAMPEPPGGGVGVVMAGSRSSVQPDSRIQEGIQDIHHGAEHHVGEDPEYHDCHHHRIVVLHNRLVK